MALRDSNSSGNGEKRRGRYQHKLNREDIEDEEEEEESQSFLLWFRDFSFCWGMM